MAERPSNQGDIIAAYADCPRQLDEALRGLPERGLDLRPAGGGWSIREIVHHIVDGDDLWKMFVTQALGHPGSEFTPQWYWQVPQDDLARSWGYGARAVEPSLALFRANRAHTAQLLRAAPGSLERTLRVRWPQIGEADMPVAGVLEGQTQHAALHIADIRAIRESHGV